MSRKIILELMAGVDMSKENKVDEAINYSANKVDAAVHEVVSSNYVRLAFRWLVSIFGGGAIGFFTALLSEVVFDAPVPAVFLILGVVGLFSFFVINKIIGNLIN